MSNTTRALTHATVCGKPGYAKPDAEKRARIMRRKADETLPVYRCQKCRMFHVGHTDGSR